MAEGVGFTGLGLAAVAAGPGLLALLGAGGFLGHGPVAPVVAGGADFAVLGFAAFADPGLQTILGAGGGSHNLPFAEAVAGGVDFPGLGGVAVLAVTGLNAVLGAGSGGGHGPVTKAVAQGFNDGAPLDHAAAVQTPGVAGVAGSGAGGFDGVTDFGVGVLKLNGQRLGAAGRIVELLVLHGDGGVHSLQNLKGQGGNGALGGNLCQGNVAEGQLAFLLDLGVVGTVQHHIFQSQIGSVVAHGNQAVGGGLRSGDGDGDGLLASFHIGVGVGQQFSLALVVDKGNSVGSSVVDGSSQFLSGDGLRLHGHGRLGVNNSVALSRCIAGHICEDSGPHILAHIAEPDGGIGAGGGIVGQAEQFIGLASEGRQIQVTVLAHHHGGIHILHLLITGISNGQIGGCVIHLSGVAKIIGIDPVVPDVVGIIQQQEVLGLTEFTAPIILYDFMTQGGHGHQLGSTSETGEVTSQTEDRDAQCRGVLAGQ